MCCAHKGMLSRCFQRPLWAQLADFGGTSWSPAGAPSAWACSCSEQQWSAAKPTWKRRNGPPQAIERTVDTKASRAEVATSLQQKANAADMAAKIKELETLLSTKADTADMERRALKTELDASLRTQMSDM
jgi:hypothetical protein